jgi:hypothetical protein
MQGKHVPFVALAVLLLATLACGGFQVRVTPSPAPPTTAAEAALTDTGGTPAAQGEGAESAGTPVLSDGLPTPTTTPTVAQVIAGMAPGATARVTASGGVNVRAEPSTRAQQVGRLNVNTNLTILEGPQQADNYTWWRVDNGAGLAGWVASGPENDPWLVPAVAAATAAPAPTVETPGAPKPVNRDIKVGDRVQVTTEQGQVLTVRNDAGTSAAPVARVLRGTLFTVKSGPIKQDNFTWWELEGDKLNGWAAEGDGTTRWLTPVE